MGKQKINIVHYLNKRLKPSHVNGQLEYPVYVRVSYDRKNERVKSVWINHTCSENDFQHDKRIVALKQYEAEIIEDIINFKDDKTHIVLKSRLSMSQKGVTNIFLENMFQKDEIKNQLIEYISNHANISKGILNPFFRIELNSEQWRELFNKDIFKQSTHDKIKYLYMLLSFESLNYNTDSLYTAGCLFVYHEWKNKNKEKEFLKYAVRLGLLSNEVLKELTKTFNEMLISIMTFDFYS